MTEEEWIACGDPTRMLGYLRGKASGRKLRLLVVACSHRIWDLMPTASRLGIEVLELYADGLVTSAEFRTAAKRASDEALAADRDPPDTLTYATASAGISDPPTIPSASSTLDTAATAWGCSVAENAPDGEYDQTLDTARSKEVGEQTRLLREIFGNPFRPIAFNPAWRTTDVSLLARGIYEEKAFDRMPILADALQDAGCDSEDILNHLRDATAAHTRGCWALDLVLDKE